MIIMIFVDLSEGLGNQMFQYAFARQLQERFDESIYLDIMSYTRNKGVRHFALEHFWLNNKVKYKVSLKMKMLDIIGKTVRKIVKKSGTDFYNPKSMKCFEKYGFYMFSGVFGYVDYDYDDTKRIRLKFVLGSWMNERYFGDIREKLLFDFKLKEDLNQKNKAKLQEINQLNSVCIHIRLGDYLEPRWSYLNVCTENYYRKAIDVICSKVENPVFYIFSNTSKDIEWIKEHYTFLQKYNFVDLQNSDYEDLELMKHCKHFVISNSTYSWWAQYLCENTNKIVVAPNVWVKSNDVILGWNINGETLGIYQDSWEIVSV